MTARACPSCTAPMCPFQAGAIELDRCSFCRGLWFDGGELEHVLGKKLVGSLETAMITTRKCAKCSVALHPAELGGLRVEVCLTCRGVFLDDGELVKLNDGKQVRVTQEAKPATPAPRAESDAQLDVKNWLTSLGL